MDTIDELDEACEIFHDVCNNYKPTDFMLLIDEICCDCEVDKTAFINRLIYNLLGAAS